MSDRKKQRTVGYLVTWTGYPMRWSPKSGCFFTARGRQSATLMATRRVAAARISQSVKVWEDRAAAIGKYRLLRVVAEVPR